MGQRKEGKKIDTVLIRTRTKDYRLDLRMVRANTRSYSKHPDIFLVDYSDKIFEGKTPEEAVQKAKEYLDKLSEVVWERWIELKFNTVHKNERDGWHTDRWNQGERVLDDICGLVLRFNCYDISKDPVGADGDNDRYYKYHLRRLVKLDAEGIEIAVEKEERHAYRDGRDGLIPFSLKRWQVLAQVDGGIKKLTAMLCHVFTGDHEETARMLDAANVKGLLGAASK